MLCSFRLPRSVSSPQRGATSPFYAQLSKNGYVDVLVFLQNILKQAVFSQGTSGSSI